MGTKHIPPTNPSYQKFGGWKLHMVPKTPADTEAIKTYLTKYCQASWKHLNGGEAQQTDFTVYIGSFEEALKASEHIERGLGNHLGQTPLNETTDRQFGRLLGGRFDTKGTQSDLKATLYGKFGIPICDKLGESWNLYQTPQTRLQALQTSYDLLKNNLGTYFTGDTLQRPRTLESPWWRG